MGVRGKKNVVKLPKNQEQVIQNQGFKSQQMYLRALQDYYGNKIADRWQTNLGKHFLFLLKKKYKIKLNL